MDVGALANSIWSQLLTVWNAPVPFLALTMLLVFVIWKIVHREFSIRLANAASQLGLAHATVTEYERKAGATPDEAAKRIDALEQAVADLRPKRFTQEQMAIVSGRLHGRTGHITVVSEMGYADGQVMSDQLARVLMQAGFQVSTGGIAGPPTRAPQGLLVRASEDGLGLALTSTFDAAGIAYAHQPTTPSAAIEILFIQPAL